MFNDNLQQTFLLFSWMHVIPVVIILSISVLIYKHKNALQKEPVIHYLRFSLAGIILLQEGLLHIYRLNAGIWSVSLSLPLQLCSIGVILTATLLITQNKRLFQKVAFIILIGASLALITPGINSGYGFPHFRYFQFFIAHGLIVINITVLLFVFDYQKDIEYKHLLHNFVSLIGIALFVYVVNVITDGNYMYLMHKPAPGTLFDAFGKYPIYIFQILLLGIPFFFHLFYFPFFIRNLIHSNNKQMIS